MQSLRRGMFVLVVLIAAAIAAEPLIHTHPLAQMSTAPCAVCVSAVARISAPAPAAVAPILVVFTMRPVVQRAVAANVIGPLASRAPPAV